MARKGVGIGVNAAARARDTAATARRRKMAMAPEGVNPARWLALREGRALSVDRVMREARAAIRALGGRPAQVGRETWDQYEAALLRALQPTLDMIEAIQAQRKAKRARRRLRQRTEDQEWPTYWNWPTPGGVDHPARKVEELEGPGLAAYNRFTMTDADAVMPLQACFEDYERVWREEDPRAEDREMPLALARQAESACRTAAWYQHVLDAEWGTLPLDVYTDAWAEEIATVLAAGEADDGGEGGWRDQPVVSDDDEDIPF